MSEQIATPRVDGPVEIWPIRPRSRVVRARSGEILGDGLGRSLRRLGLLIVSGWLVVLLAAALWFQTYAPSTEEVILEALEHVRDGRASGALAHR